jgi:hypothetical protein
MAKSPNQVERDPWEDEDFEESLKEPVRLVPIERDEDVQMRASKASEDEWVIKYPDGKRTPNQYDLKARAKRSKFLHLLSKTGSVKKSALQVGLTPRALTKARMEYDDFKLNWDIALEIYYQFEAEESIRHRAIDGTLEPIVYQGLITGYKRTYDSGLTQFWYKANMRDKYGEQSEVKISGNINHGVAMLPAQAVDPDAWEKRAARTLEIQKENMIDITPTVVDTKPVNVQKNGQIKVER